MRRRLSRPQRGGDRLRFALRGVEEPDHAPPRASAADAPRRLIDDRPTPRSADQHGAAHAAAASLRM
jgi:hypothetical protein